MSPILDYINQQARDASAASAQPALRNVLDKSAQKAPENLHLALSLRVLIFLVVSAAGVVSAVAIPVSPPIRAVLLFGAFALAIVLVRIVHVAAQWERGLVLRLGKLHSVRGPGVVLIFPVIDWLRLVDTRVQARAIPQQHVITRDNIPVAIDAVLFFRVADVMKAVTVVRDFEFSIVQYAQAALRDVIGGLTLDEMLAELERIEERIQGLVAKVAAGWGLEVEALRLQDINMPEDLKKMMSRQASAEREKRATITKAEGDKLAAVNLADAAKTMLDSPGAMQLRTLQTIDGLGPQPSNTVVLAVPSDLFTLAGHVNAIYQKKAAMQD
jgi:hypothetical protein